MNCALCNTNTTESEEHGGKWCSETCRWWSDVLVKTISGDVCIKSDAAWRAFYRTYHKNPLISDSEIPDPRAFFTVLTDVKTIGHLPLKTTKRKRLLRFRSHIVLTNTLKV